MQFNEISKQMLKAYRTEQIGLLNGVVQASDTGKIENFTELVGT